MAFGQTEFNKVSVDLAWGVNKAFTGPMVGRATSKNFSHIELGARYMLNNKYGISLSGVYEDYKTNIKTGAKSNDFTTTSIAIKFEGIYNFANVLDFNTFSKRFGAYAHTGPALVLNTGKSTISGASYNLDKLASWTAGLALQVKITPRIAIKGDVSFLAYLQGNRSLDLQYRKKDGLTNGFDGTSGHMTIGANFYLGKSAEHADWTPTQYGPDPAELDALKAKIAKAEKDMMDDDRDGVPNYIDQEPGTAEGANVNTKGVTVIEKKVVDIDGDGVLDINDFCPTIKGVSSANGCPDKDGDGIYDFIDKCPNAAGLSVDNGCPVVKDKDKATMTKAMKGVQFDSGKASIVKKSLPILDEVAKVMISNPNYKLSIEGHTDNKGNAAANLKLSDDRAKAVKAYLVGKGVSDGRMNAQGFGDTKPKASNKTAKGDRKSVV